MQPLVLNVTVGFSFISKIALGLVLQKLLIWERTVKIARAIVKSAVMQILVRSVVLATICIRINVMEVVL